MSPSSIAGMNKLPAAEKREIYSRIIPESLVDLFNLPLDYHDESGNDLLSFKYAPGSPSVEISLKHKVDFPDPFLPKRPTISP